MTKEQVQQHGDIIKWFCDNPKKGVWIKRKDTDTDIGLWDLVKIPKWVLYCIYVPNDEYAELRKALADGKQIIYKFGKWTNGQDRWLDLKVSPTSFNYGNDFYNYEWKFKTNVNLVEVRQGEYRIKLDKPKFKTGDWVRSIREKSYIEQLTDKRVSEILSHQCLTDIYEPWTPQEGDAVILFNDNPEQFTLAKYQTADGDKHQLVSYSGKWTEIFKNCIPYIGQPFEEIK